MSIPPTSDNHHTNTRTPASTLWAKFKTVFLPATEGNQPTEKHIIRELREDLQKMKQQGPPEEQNQGPAQVSTKDSINE